MRIPKLGKDVYVRDPDAEAKAERLKEVSDGFDALIDHAYAQGFETVVVIVGNPRVKGLTSVGTVLGRTDRDPIAILKVILDKMKRGG